MLIHTGLYNPSLKNICKSIIMISSCLSLFFISIANAGGMEVNPGLWEIKSQVTSMGGTHENVSQDCIQETEFTPESMMDDASGCAVTDSSSNDSSMEWTMSCQNGGVTMTGTGHAESSGSSLTGGMNINADFNGQKITMSTNWDGKRIGNCP